jgi:hypothetical protein
VDSRLQLIRAGSNFRWTGWHSTPLVLPDMVTSLAIKDTVMDAWESIKMMRIGDEWIRKASAQRVRCE